jgi:hypothetical protein
LCFEKPRSVPPSDLVNALPVKLAGMIAFWGWNFDPVKVSQVSAVSRVSNAMDPLS